MANNMEKESLLKQVVKVDMENGLMAKELNGSNLENRYVIENFSQINYKFIFINSLTSVNAKKIVNTLFLLEYLF